jgi:hypothetical protein
MSGAQEQPAVIERWHRLVADRDMAALDDLLADDVVFHSPVVHTPQSGKPLTRMYLQAAMHVLGNGDFRYVGEWYAPGGAVLEFRTRLGDIEIDGIDMISWNDEGRITEFKVMVRPLKAVNLLHDLMRRMLEAAQAGGSASGGGS